MENSKIYDVKNINELCEFLKKQESKFYIKGYPGSGEKTSLVSEENFRTVFERVKSEGFNKKIFFMVVEQPSEQPIQIKTRIESCDFDPSLGDILPKQFEATTVE